MQGQCDVLGQISCSSSGVSKPGPTTLDASLWKEPTWWFEGPPYCECQRGCPENGIRPFACAELDGFWYWGQ